MQLKHLVINGSAPLLMLEGLFRTPQSFASLLRFSLWAKHGGHSSWFLPGILFLKLWPAVDVRECTPLPVMLMMIIIPACHHDDDDDDDDDYEHPCLS